MRQTGLPYITAGHEDRGKFVVSARVEPSGTRFTLCHLRRDQRRIHDLNLSDFPGQLFSKPLPSFWYLRWPRARPSDHLVTMS